MYAIEFETDIKNQFIEIKDYEKLINKHAKVIIMVADMPDDNEELSASDDMQKKLYALMEARKQFPQIAPEIAIDNLCNEINSDIF